MLYAYVKQIDPLYNVDTIADGDDVLKHNLNLCFISLLLFDALVYNDVALCKYYSHIAGERSILKHYRIGVLNILKLVCFNHFYYRAHIKVDLVPFTFRMMNYFIYTCSLDNVVLWLKRWKGLHKMRYVLQ